MHPSDRIHIAEHPARHGCLRPQEQIRRGCGGEIAQEFHPIENLRPAFHVHLVPLLDVRLHSRDTQRHGLRGRLLRADEHARAEAEREHDQPGGDRKIKVRTQADTADLRTHAQDGDEQDCIAHHDQETEAADAGEFRDLDQRQVTVQRDAELVPAEAREHPSAHPLERDPRYGAENRDAEIPGRLEQQRTLETRKWIGSRQRTELRSGNPSGEPRPHRRVKREVCGKEQRQADQRAGTEERREFREPRKCDGEKDKARDVAEREVPPSAPFFPLRNPHRHEQRDERDESKPADIRRRKTEHQQHTAEHRRQPRPRAL